jgi:type IV pilus assembly protein PilF
MTHLNPVALTRHFVARVALWASVVMLAAACTSQTTVTEARPGRESAGTASSEADKGNPERRARARLELASLYLSRGQANEALGDVNDAIAAKPDFAEAYGLRGLIYGALGNMALAEQNFQRALQLAPNDPDARHNYGWFLCQQQRYGDADVQFDNAVAQTQNREVVRTLLAKGVCLARAGKWPEAERTLSRSYELDPSNPATAYNLSDVLLRRGDLQRARFYVGRINAVREQSNAQSLWLAARIEHGLGNETALQDFGRQLRERFPQSTEALQFERGRFDE